jgi:hypothetical protein
MAQRTFSYAYNKYVNGDDEDLPGLIAYALYKRAKVAFLQSYKERSGREATESRIGEWSAEHSTPEAIELFRLQALRSVEKYRMQEVKKAEPEIRKAIEAEHIGLIHSKVSSLTGFKAFLSSVCSGIAASVVWLPLAGLMYIGLRQANPMGLVDRAVPSEAVTPPSKK